MRQAHERVTMNIDLLLTVKSFIVKPSNFINIVLDITNIYEYNSVQLIQIHDIILMVPLEYRLNYLIWLVIIVKMQHNNTYFCFVFVFIQVGN